MIEVYKTKLSEIEFPLVKLCLSEIENPEKRYEAHGYEDVDSFFMGLNQYNHTLFGWRGFQEDSISSGSVEYMLQNVSFNWMDVLKSIYFVEFGYLYSDYKVILPQAVDWNPVPLYPSCQVLDLMKYVNNTKAPINVIFIFNNVKNLGVSVYFEERNKIISRSSKKNSMAYRGPLIRNKNLEELRIFKYFISITQNIDSDKDTKKDCVNYPTEEFESFDHCDKSAIRSKMQNEFGVTPFWITDDFNNVTDIWYEDTGKLCKFSKNQKYIF